MATKDKTQTAKPEGNAKNLAELAENGAAFEEQVADQIREKVRAGLSREQALEVIRAQIANDQPKKQA